MGAIPQLIHPDAAGAARRPPILRGFAVGLSIQEFVGRRSDLCPLKAPQTPVSRANIGRCTFGIVRQAFDIGDRENTKENFNLGPGQAIPHSVEHLGRKHPCRVFSIHGYRNQGISRGGLKREEMGSSFFTLLGRSIQVNVAHSFILHHRQAIQDLARLLEHFRIYGKFKVRRTSRCGCQKTEKRENYEQRK